LSLRTRTSRRRPQNLRAVVTDVDGTITDRDRRLSVLALRAIRSLDARGIPVVFATGNVLPIMVGLQRFLGIRTPLVAENGGLVYFDESKIVRLARKGPALRAYRDLRRQLPVRRLFTDRWRETEVALEPNVDPEDVARRLRGYPLRVEYTGFAIHLFEPTAGKEPAVRLALEPYGFSLADCLVAGDGDNDVGMLRRAGVGVSFPDASERARQAATYVTRSRHGEGFVEALKHFGLLPSSFPSHDSG
jgi:phosphoglycolate phosphatase (TIGR01487 family)